MNAIESTHTGAEQNPHTDTHGESRVKRYREVVEKRNSRHSGDREAEEVSRQVNRS